ncbi:YfcC family protein [Clostridium ihumii]|uniref:YfcC family protein n=1 Tax=Clostridium ihumii TaxID=1470356 RepID=UPI00058EF7FB|nr:AbgT family transporter [Clostridium ihumii]
MKKKKFQFPSAYTILLTLTLVIGILTHFVPEVIPAKVSDVVLAPMNGMVGVRDDAVHSAVQEAMQNEGTEKALEVLRESENQYINMYNAGSLKGAIDVALCTIIIGGFLGVVTRTGVLDAGVGAIVKKLKGKEIYLIPVIMILLSIGGTAWGMCEDSLAFYVIITATMIMAGFDSVTSVAAMILGAGTGVLGSTINPFCIGAAVAGAEAVGVSINQGTVIGLGIALWFTTLAISIFFVMRYAKKVKADPTKSLMTEEERKLAKDHFVKEQTEEHTFTTRKKICLALFGLTFLVMVIGVVPWENFGINFLAENTGAITGTYLGAWYFNEITIWFLIMSIVVGKVYGLKEKELISAFMKGAEEMIGVALIVAVSRGVSFLMTNSGLDLFVLDKAVGVLNGVSGIAFINITYMIFMGLGFLIPSTSGLASVTMPIFAPLAQRLDIAPELVISAFSAGSGILNLVTPTSGVIMGGLAIAKVEYSTWLKFVGKVLLCIFIATCLILSVGIMIL